jgi:hypothetical protein
LRLLDCFRLATPAESDAFAGAGAGAVAAVAFLLAARLFLLSAAVSMTGPSSGASRAYEGEAMVTVSAIGHGGGERGRSVPASSGRTALESSSQQTERRSRVEHEQRAARGRYLKWSRSEAGVGGVGLVGAGISSGRLGMAARRSTYEGLPCGAAA